MIQLFPISKKIVCLSAFVLGFSGMTLTFAQTVNDNEVFHVDPIIGEVNGQPIRVSEINNRELDQAYRAFIEQLQFAFANEAVNRLSDSSDEYKKLQDIEVSEESIETFYQQNSLQANGDLASMRPSIENFLRQQQFSAQYLRAVDSGELQVYLELPPELLLTTTVDKRAIRGASDKPVMVLEFSDYQCPYCSRVQTTVESLMQDYGDQVAFAYRHLPLPFHKEADEAAVAVECAKDQQQFEAMHARLFENQRAQHIDDLKRYAEEIGIEDMAAFNRCLDEDQYRSIVEADMAAASALGIRGTPGFIIGSYDPQTGQISGSLISGAAPEAQFRALITRYLEPNTAAGASEG